MPAARVSIPQAPAPPANTPVPAVPPIEPTTLTAAPDSAGPLPDRVRAVLQQIRPAVQADGGDVEFVDITDDGTARVRFKGACIGCPSSNLTLHMGIERALRTSVPEIKGVVAVP